MSGVLLTTLLPRQPFTRNELAATLRIAGEAPASSKPALAFGSAHEDSLEIARSSAEGFRVRTYHTPFVRTPDLVVPRVHEIGCCRQQLYRMIISEGEWCTLLSIDADLYIPWSDVARYLPLADEKHFVNFPYCPRNHVKVPKVQLGAFAIRRSRLTKRAISAIYRTKRRDDGRLEYVYADDCNLRNALKRSKMKEIVARDISSWHYGAQLRKKSGGCTRYENGRAWYEPPGQETPT